MLYIGRCMMKKKVNYEKLLDICYWLFIGINTFIKTYNFVIVDLLNELKNIDLSSIAIDNYVNFLFTLIFVLIFLFITTIINYNFLTILYFGIKISKRWYMKDKIDKVDFKNDNYFRDILPQYSAAILSYIDNFKIDINDVVATLMILELKGKIKIDKKDIIIINIDDLNLETNEKYILNKLKNNTLRDIDLFEYNRIVMDDAKKLGLILEKDDLKKKNKNKLIQNIIISLIMFISIFVVPVLFNTYSGDNIVYILILFLLIMFVMIAVVLMPGVLFVGFLNLQRLNNMDPYVRSKKGKEINLKLEGLKKYLIEFSKIEDKKSEELKFWEEYLVYSVIFEINTSVVDDICKKI